MATATVNGVNLSYHVRGAGPPLMLAHGFASSAAVWDPVQDFLAERYQTFAFDLRGHGDSDKPPGPYRIQDFADDLLGLMNFLGLEKIDLMGHSMGGRTSLLFALQHGDRLGRLLLVGASGAAPQGDGQARFEILQRVATEEGMEAVFGHERYTFAVPQLWREGPAREAFRERFLKNTPEGFCGAAQAILGMPDLTGRLGEIETPTWVCAGELDAGPQAFNELCARRIPNCTRAVVPGCGHYPMQDNTAGFLSALSDFLEKTPAR